MKNLDKEQFQRSKDVIRIAWPKDKIVLEKQDRIIVQCENGAYLKWGLMELPPELREASPEAAKMMHGKVMLQFTENLEADTYENVSKCLFGKEESEGRLKEALQEFSKRVQIGNILTP